MTVQFSDEERERFLTRLRRRATGTRLHLGDVVLFAGRRCRVVVLNECRAKIVPLNNRIREFIPQTGVNAGQVRIFEDREDGWNISSNSELEILESGKDAR